MGEAATQDQSRLKSTLDEIKNELNTLETFLECDEQKSERFKRYLKSLYDHLKIEESTSGENASDSLPELIIDAKCVDLEQIYQQVQLLNTDASSTSIGSLTKFFSKCLVNLDDLTFGIEHQQPSSSSQTNGGGPSTSLKTGAKKLHTPSVTSNNEETDADAEQSDESENVSEDEEEEEEEDDDDDDDDIQNGKKLAGEDDEDEDEDDEDEEEEGLFGNGADEDQEDDEEEEELKRALEEDENGDGEEEDEDDEDEEGKLEDDDEDGDGDEELDDEDEQVRAELNDFDEDDDEEGRLNFDELDAEDDEEDEEERIEAEMATPVEKLKGKIDEIHDSMLRDMKDKPWQLKGEVTAKTRPQDSLMEEYLEFDHTTRQAPIIDASYTERIEQMIKQRIKDKAFDDVERKVRPVEMQYEYRKQVVLDMEKSKVGLGQVYEQEFLKQQQQKLDAESNETSNKETLDNPKHEEIRKRLQSLFIKLDALSNFHFTPKAPMPEVKVVSNMPTINMEEVAPVNVADTSLLAPEEIKSKIKALPKSKSEEDKQDKNRNLRMKKLFARRRKIEREKKLEIAHAIDPNNAALSKEMAMKKLKKQSKNMSKNIKILKNDKKDKSDKAYRSSSTFFKQLQENTEMSRNGTGKKKKIDSKDSNKISSKKLKL